MKPSEIKKLKEEKAELEKKVRDQTDYIEEVRNLMSNVPDLLFQVDKKGIFQDYSGKESDLLVPSADFIGKHISRVLPKQVAKQHLSCAEKVLKTGHMQSFEYSLIIDKEERFFETRMVFQNQRDMFISIIREITDKKRSEMALQDVSKRVKVNAIIHEEMNQVLKEKLSQKDKEMAGLKKRIHKNVRQQVNPFIEKLKETELSVHQEAYLNLIRQNLDEISTPLIKGDLLAEIRLTPSEAQIVNMIKQGKTTKNMSDFLELSTKTIETHRRNIRKKLGLTNQKENLMTILKSY